MNENTMIAASYPTIITSGGNPRVNKELIDNIFLKKYISIFGELLSKLGKIENLNIIYVGGYSKEENISRAKLYISAYNYYLNYLGYPSLSKSNLTVIEEDNIDLISEKIEQCDLLFLGIGCDKTFESIINKLDKKGLSLNKLIKEKNILVSSICSGSVMSANRIYGGVYDNYYYNKDLYTYPINVKSLNFNPVTMETDFYPNDATIEKTKTYIENYLKPDSYKCAFFACKPNSLFLISNNKIYSYGEIYLFIDGESLKIENELETSEVTNLVILVNQYNKEKNRKNIINKGILERIKSLINSLNKIPITNNINEEEQNIIEDFNNKNNLKSKIKKIKIDEWKENLKKKLEYLFSNENIYSFLNNQELQSIYQNLKEEYISSYNIDNKKDTKEIYLKMNIILLIKQAYKTYPGYYSDFKKDLYNILIDYISINITLVYYIITTCGCLFTNSEIKKILNIIKIENAKRPQQIINSTEKQLILFKKEAKYARS